MRKRKVLKLLAIIGTFFVTINATSKSTSNENTPIVHNDNYLTFTNNSNSEVKLSLSTIGSPNAVSLIYSTNNGSNWSTLSTGSNQYSISAKGNIKIAAGTSSPGDVTNDHFSKDVNNRYNFTFYESDGSTSLTNPIIAASGDVTSLFNGVGGDVDLSSSTSYVKCFYYLFKDAKCLSSCPNIPSTKLASNCYNNMFSGCTGITTVPTLPATEIATYSYRAMFYNCSNIIDIPDLSHVTSIGNNGVNNMFYTCTKLVLTDGTPGNWSIGSESTTGSTSGMFNGCTNVVCNPTPTLGTKYQLGSPEYEIKINSIGGYYSNDGVKQPICGFGATAIKTGTSTSEITKYGFTITSDSGTTITRESSDVSALTAKGNRFYTIYDCGEGATIKCKAFIVIDGNTIESLEISAVSNLDNEYSV